MSANKVGKGEHDSRLQNWIEHELVHLAMTRQKEDVESEFPDRNISLRIPVAAHLMLFRLAQKLGRSKTACAEEIVVNAVRDVYQQFDLPELTATDMHEFVQQLERGTSEPSGKRG